MHDLKLHKLSPKLDIKTYILLYPRMAIFLYILVDFITQLC